MISIVALTLKRCLPIMVLLYKKKKEIELKDYFNKYFEKQFRCEIFFFF